MRVSSNRAFISSRRSLNSDRRSLNSDTVQKNEAAMSAITVTEIDPIQKFIDNIIFWTLPRCCICSVAPVSRLSFSSSRTLSVMFSIVYYQEYSKASHSASRDVNIPGGFFNVARQGSCLTFCAGRFRRLSRNPLKGSHSWVRVNCDFQ